MQKRLFNITFPIKRENIKCLNQYSTNEYTFFKKDMLNEAKYTLQGRVYITCYIHLLPNVWKWLHGVTNFRIYSLHYIRKHAYLTNLTTIIA